MKLVTGTVFVGALLFLGASVFVAGLVSVGPGEILVLTANYGKNLPEGKVLADPGEIGIQKEVLGTGYHWVMPVFWKVKKFPVLEIPAGKIGVVTAKFGRSIQSPNRFLANDDEIGVRRRVLGPGTHRLNPYGYQVDIVPQTVVAIGHVGVLINLEKGGVVKDRVLHAGTHYINPKMYKVEIVKVGVNEYTLSSDIMPAISDEMLMGEVDEAYLETASTQKVAGAVSFPSRDGFHVGLDITVLWELSPEDAVQAVDAYGSVKDLVDRVINPKLNSACRNEGSKVSAKEMVQGDSRELFQKNFTEALRRYAEDAPLDIVTALPRGVYVPIKIQLPIMQAQLKQEQMLTNAEIEESVKMEARLEEQKKLVVQEIEQVKAATRVLRASIQAETEKMVGEYEAATRLQVSRIDLETQKLETQIADILSLAEAEVSRMRGQKQAEASRKLVSAFGSSSAYNAWVFATEALPVEKLPVQIIHSGEGTLWTDLERSGQSALQMKMLKEMQSQKKD
ncbi:MAG: hypothetical protein H3C47_12790 [Candidatus Cloacimonetes bacterium]|nr:hypothetical protein [Candidatus Cloacimonadota bacterium]